MSNKNPFENKIVEGDSLNILKQFEDESIDCIVTDPPYGYSFMNKDWDKAVVSVDIWKECLRVMKAGSFAFIMSSPRQDVLCKMILNLIDAGFETNFTSIYWTYASGFPKAANVSKLVDKRLGAERKKIGLKSDPRYKYNSTKVMGIITKDDTTTFGKFEGNNMYETEAATEQAKKLDGSYAGFQPKPALETILVVMKPLSQRNYVEQALDNSKGITWLDDCRIPFQNGDDWNTRGLGDAGGINAYGKYAKEQSDSNPKGRFPANLIVSDDALNDGKIRKVGTIEKHHYDNSTKTNKIYSNFPIITGDKHTSYGDTGSYSRYFDLDKWYEAQFIITPKASASERNKGLEDLEPKAGGGFSHEKPHHFGGINRENWKDPNKIHYSKNNHPTVKPLKLMSYLITMGSRENDIILDPFCGSGTTCIAATILNRRYIGIELQKEYVDIANKRLESYKIQNKITQF